MEDGFANLRAMHEGIENKLEDTLMAGIAKYDKAAAYEKLPENIMKNQE